MNFGQAIQSGFRNYVGFTGRARRSEFWWWVLFQVLVSFVAASLWGISRSSALYGLTTLILFLPALALEVRRLHDVGRSGWWLLISFVPLVGIILLLVWFCKDGTVGTNRFGADPKLRSGVDPELFGAAGASSEDLARLEQLGRLRDQNVLTQAEFEAEKAKLMGARS